MSCTCLPTRLLRSPRPLFLAARALSTSTALPSSPSTSTPKPSPALPASSCPAGTVFKGLNLLKTGSDPVALEDNEYPAWVWTLPSPSTGASGGGAGRGKPAVEAVKSDVEKLRDARRELQRASTAQIKARNTLKAK